MINARVVLLLLPVLLPANVVHAQDIPAKPIRIVTAGAGGSVDLSARLIAQAIAGPLGQQIIVDNRVDIVAIELVSKAAPDGTTLLFQGSTVWLLPFLRSSVPYDPVRDFAPIILGSRYPNVLVTHPALPVKSTQELIALAKARPGALNYGTVGTATSTHLSAELFKNMAGIDVVRVPYKAPAPALAALMSGEVQFMLQTTATVTPHIKSGRVKALAVSSAQPSALFPTLPTVASTGLPGFSSESLLAMFAPAKTPAAVITRLNQETNRALVLPDVKEKFLNAGIETGGGTPEAFAATMKAEMARMGKVIKDAGIRDE